MTGYKDYLKPHNPMFDYQDTQTVSFKSAYVYGGPAYMRRDGFHRVVERYGLDGLLVERIIEDK